jgi:hypothetical protein
MYHHKHVAECISACEECKAICENVLFNHMLPRGGSHIDAENVGLILDTISICQTTADFLRRNSLAHVFICHACVVICSACAKSCEALAQEHPKIRECGNACAKCAKRCRVLSGALEAA